MGDVAVVEEPVVKVQEKKRLSVIEVFDLSDKLPEGIKGDIRLTETQANGRIDDGDIHTIYSLACVGFRIQKKEHPEYFDFTEVRKFYGK